MIPAVIERCAGIDVGKKFVVACAISGAVNGDGQAEIRKFGTDNLNLERLAAWLEECGCTHVVMESTGDYWRPIYNVLEEATDAELVLANAQQVKGLRGHKTDPDDAHWLAHLLRHGMIRPSFIPPLEIRQLRDLTRRRKQLVRAGAQERNRIQKTLESANIKLGNVLTDIFGVSGQLMLDKLIEGKATAGEIADLAQKKARKKIPQIRASLEGHRINAIHRAIINQALDHMAFLEEQIDELDALLNSAVNTLPQSGRLHPSTGTTIGFTSTGRSADVTRTPACLVLYAGGKMKMTPRLNAFAAEPKLMRQWLEVGQAILRSGLEDSLVKLVEIRASQINGCAFCLHMHTTGARQHGESEARIYLLDAWRESPLYTPRERAALAWTEALTLLPETHAPDDVYEQLREHFKEDEQVKLTLLIVAINGWNRLSVGFRAIHPVEERQAA